MLGFGRRRPTRTRPLQRRSGSGLEILESRQLLSSSGYQFYHPANFPVAKAQTNSPQLYVNHPIGNGQRTLAGLDNDGKVLTGKDRQGDEWQITVHGPGVVIVTDATPNDGALDDDLDTIQIVGSDPEKTFVTGQVVASARVITDGTVLFNHLFAENGVNHIVLNGFNLARTVDPPPGQFNNENYEIYLPGGVQYLSFNNVEGQFNPGTNDQPFEIVIGRLDVPLRVAPTIKIGSILNSVFDSTEANVPLGLPPTDPTVSIIVNGPIQSLEMVSATAQPNVPAGFQFVTPTVGTTGRTAVRATAIDGLKVDGTARNFTVSRGAVPFANSFAGLSRLGHAAFGGPTDGVGLDVSHGNIGRLTLLKGLGDPTGNLSGAQNLGRPVSQWGNSAFGLLGGTVVAQNIDKLEAGPNSLVFQTGQDPDFQQIDGTGSTTFYTRPGRAFTNAVVMTDGSIRNANIVGDLQGSEIKTGSNYFSYLAGLQAVRQPSRITPIRVRGSLVDSVISATYRATDGIYGNVDDATATTNDEAGPGLIRGQLQQGGIFYGNTLTALYQQGTGFYAKYKQGYLPPLSRPTRIQNVNVDY